MSAAAAVVAAALKLKKKKKRGRPPKDHPEDDSSQKKMCATCGVLVSSYGGHFKRHVMTHDTERKRYSCDVCSKTFSRSDHLSRHRRKHTQSIQYFCRYCNRAFTRRDRLRIHEKTHDEQAIENSFCEICGEVFNSEERLATHKKELHANNGGEKSEEEMKNFNSNQRAKKSIMGPPRTRRFNDIQFWQSGIHLLSTSVVGDEGEGEDHFVCTKCAEEFADWNKVAEHMLQHSVLGPSFRVISNQEFKLIKEQFKAQITSENESLSNDVVTSSDPAMANSSDFSVPMTRTVNGIGTQSASSVDAANNSEPASTAFNRRYGIYSAKVSAPGLSTASIQ